MVQHGCLGSSPFSFFFSTIVAFLILTLVEEIEQMNSLFQQKQRELVLAVSKVEELTRQLEMLKNGRIDGHHDNQSAVAELDRLYKELQVNRCDLWHAVAPPHNGQAGPGFRLLFLQAGRGRKT